MRLHLDTDPTANTITAYGPGYFEINKVRYDHAVVFGPRGDVQRWPADSIDDVDAAALAQAAEGEPEVVLVGTGSKQRFLGANLVRPWLKAGVGVEMMTTQAAARSARHHTSDKPRAKASAPIVTARPARPPRPSAAANSAVAPAASSAARHVTASGSRNHAATPPPSATGSHSTS